MKTVYADKQKLHHPLQEIYCGKIVPCAEKPSRAENVYKAVVDNKLGPVISPKKFSIDHLTNVHDRAYVDFLQDAYKDWIKAGFDGDAFATNFNMQHGCLVSPKAIEGKMGYFLADTSVSITKGTWEATEQSAYAALTALDCIIEGDHAAFALTRPPGHHATASIGAGYCFLNYAAITTQTYLNKGYGKVAILDVDYHHGNGTQGIFYGRNDVLYCSLHADPAFDFPYFSGYADETGVGAGEGYTRNYPMPFGTDWGHYKEALQDAVKRINAYNADLLIVSLGVDTFKDDPISKFKLESPDYIKMGAEIARINKPSLFILEGGYAINDIGTNVLNVLEGFLGR